MQVQHCKCSSALAAVLVCHCSHASATMPVQAGQCRQASAGMPVQPCQCSHANAAVPRPCQCSNNTICPCMNESLASLNLTCSGGGCQGCDVACMVFNQPYLSHCRHTTGQASAAMLFAASTIAHALSCSCTVAMLAGSWHATGLWTAGNNTTMLPAWCLLPAACCHACCHHACRHAARCLLHVAYCLLPAACCHACCHACYHAAYCVLHVSAVRSVEIQSCRHIAGWLVQQCKCSSASVAVQVHVSLPVCHCNRASVSLPVCHCSRAGAAVPVQPCQCSGASAAIAAPVQACQCSHTSAGMRVPPCQCSSASAALPQPCQCSTNTVCPCMNECIPAQLKLTCSDIGCPGCDIACWVFNKPYMSHCMHTTG
jgi:hypothetical protein